MSTGNFAGLDVLYSNGSVQGQSMNMPIALSLDEWREIMQMPEVREAWGLSDETVEEFAATVYGVKFDFESGGPGYFGDLYILQGDALTGDAPFVVVRKNGILTLVT